ncbi:indolepyruvate ferredoxin oxidoreductase subunit alpha [Zongyangia hominis]|uniref:Indolepyruvate oxidoreductase subunit IorA n=1 Tax=Zongyangia hominis TaxID=2763677 RepID=A0A926I7I7_9FIRM|nr:indolepyruvate ferredoxin oxidoreductase subunit alpha [Zongyangia hominis]MBC8571154.1 indolepyruvate ferredoxin oxidoreductase subunit alpha [Zongyangia hominis]
MNKQFLMGNEAIGLAAIAAGVRFVSGYPGTPSTEILETIAKHNPGDIYVEWSVNEKAALEAAAGAAYAGARAMVTMKQVGLNVASDPLMSLAYIGVKGGMVIVVADDPGPISSQTEQDTRHFARFAKVPVFDPSSPEEAYDMVENAFALSEEYGTPVFLRPTTRVCHGCATIEEKAPLEKKEPEGFVKDPRWVIFPRLSLQRHGEIEAALPRMGEALSQSPYNRIEVTGKVEEERLRLGVASGGVSYEYTREALGDTGVRLLKVGTPHPFPEALALEFLDGLDEVLVIEELDPVIERELVYLCGKHHLNVHIRGKLTGDNQNAGENSVESVRRALIGFLDLPQPEGTVLELPSLPVRPPVLCAGCPHRASFYAVKQAMKGRKAVFSGDIGCYTLGNAAPLHMVDTCLCMGADVTIAQGLHRIEPDAVNFAFIGDSTFFASGMTGVVNAVYNQTDIVLIVLDNSTTAMTGQQPHPGTGRTMMGNISDKISIEKVLTAIGVSRVLTADPLNLKEAENAVREAAGVKGVSAVIFRSPCIAVTKPAAGFVVDKEKCIGCKKCIRELGCPAVVWQEGKAAIEPSLCYGCSICAQVCPCGAIEKMGGEAR